MSNKSALIFLIVGSIFSSIFIGIGALFLNKNQAMLEEGIATQAVCVGNTTSLSSDGDSYYPMVEFETEDGQLVQATINMGSSPPEYQNGDAVPIIYLADTPAESVTLNTPFWMVTFPWIFLGIGIFVQIVFALIFVGSKLKKVPASNNSSSINSSNQKKKKNPFRME